MKLYYLKGACSLATYICLNETGRQFEAFEVDRQTRKASDGKELAALNAKGYVPVLVLDDGQVLTENVAVLSYVAGLDPSKKLAPSGPLGQTRLIEALAFVNTELHKTVGALFNPRTPDGYKTLAVEMAQKRLQQIETMLGQKPFLTGEDFSAADAYLWVVLSWMPRLNIDLAGFPRIQDFQKRVGARPSVKAALKGEGLE